MRVCRPQIRDEKREIIELAWRSVWLREELCAPPSFYFKRIDSVCRAVMMSVCGQMKAKSVHCTVLTRAAMRGSTLGHTWSTIVHGRYHRQSKTAVPRITRQSSLRYRHGCAFTAGTDRAIPQYRRCSGLAINSLTQYCLTPGSLYLQEPSQD